MLVTYAVCSVEGCGRKHNAKGLCKKHWKRVWRHGTLECARPRNSLTYGPTTKEESKQYGLLYRLAFPEIGRESAKKWRIANPNKRREYERGKRLENPNFDREKRAKNPELYRKILKEYRLRHKDRLSANAKARRISDVNWHLRCVLRCRILQALRKGWKSGSAIALLGCSISEFKIYLESKFEPGMSWKNYGRGLDRWNIDHIIPCASFDLTQTENQHACFHFSNMQPMWMVENSAKGCRVLPC